MLGTVAAVVLFASPAAVAAPTGKIAFVRGGQIWTSDASGQNAVQITPSSPGHSATAPAFSPDASRIAYADNGQIEVISADGSGVPVAVGPAGHTDPTWSPAGDEIAAAQTTYPTGIDVFRVSDGHVTNTFSSPDAYHYYSGPAWKPTASGAVIAAVKYSGGKGIDEGQVVVLSGSGGEQPLTSSGRFDEPMLAWTPDGTSVAYHEDCPQYISGCGAGARKLLTTGGSHEIDAAVPSGDGVSFSPDGSYVAYNKSGSVHVRALAGGSATPIAAADDSGGVSWSPRSKGHRLSGRLTGPRCKDGECKDEGVGKVSVKATGTTTGGEPASGSAVSAASGDWSIPLPAGTYTVRPAGAGWTPKSRTVKVSADTGKVNFAKCRIDNTFFGWKLTGECPAEDKVDDGAKPIAIDPPSGAPADFGDGLVGDKTNYALPVRDAAHRYELAQPVALPDLDLGSASFHLSAYQNTLTSKGIQSGLAALRMPGIVGSVYDLSLNKDLTGGASEVDLQMPGGIVLNGQEVEVVDRGLRVGKFEIGLPESLGGAVIRGERLEIGPDGVRGDITGGEITISDMHASVEGGRVDDHGFHVDKTSLELPEYLGGGQVEADGLDYHDGHFSVERASGSFRFSVPRSGTRHVEVLAKLDELRFLPPSRDLPEGGYVARAHGEVTVPPLAGGSRDLFKAAATLDVASVQCPPVPPGGTCRNGAFLHTADLEIHSSQAVPLGGTGLGINGLDAHVKSDIKGAHIDAGGIHGVTYTFGLGADLRTLALLPNGTPVFDGHIAGSLSTNGNLGVGVNGTAFGYLDLAGGICVIGQDPADACDALNLRGAKFPAGMHAPTVAVAGRVGAGVDYELGTGLAAHAEIEAHASGRFVAPSGATGGYLDAHVGGRMSAGVHSPLLPGGIDGEGTLDAELGRFTSPHGGSVLGIKGTLQAKLHLESPTGDHLDREVRRDVFVDENGNYVETDAAGYVQHGPAGRPRSAGAAPAQTFTVRPGERDLLASFRGYARPAAMTLKTPGGATITAREDAAGRRTIVVHPADTAAYLVTGGGGLGIYVARPKPGRWSVELQGESDSTRFEAVGRLPAPRLRVASPAHRVRLRGRHRSVAIRGRVSGAGAGARVSIFAATARCRVQAGQNAPDAPGIPLASRVRVKNGRWHYTWKTTKRTAPGSYVPYATLDNGNGRPVVDCARGTVVVPKRHRAHRSLRPGARAAAFLPISAVRFGQTRIPEAGYAVVHDTSATPGSGDCAWAIKLLSSEHVTPAKPDKPDSKLPVFDVYPTKTPCIAANDAAAITGVDPSTRAAAVTVIDERARKKAPRGYRRYTAQSGFSVLTYAFHAGATTNPKGYAAAHRREACGRDPFFDGHKPGPPDGTYRAGPADGKYQPKTKYHLQIGGEYTSCDEFPFASTTDGGDKAIVRGVPLAENNDQGRDLSSFYRNKATGLGKKTSSGRFVVCVVGLACPPSE